MESFFVRYRNLFVLMVLLIVQVIGLAVQVRRTTSGRVVYDPADSTGVRLIRLWANMIVSPPERAVQTSKTGAGSIWQSYFDLRHIRQENKQLQETIDRLRLEQAALLEDARQGQRLQSQLSFQEKYIYNTLLAQVIGTSGSDQSRVFYIDKGKDAGLTRDMAVITPDGIVGKVREVFPHSAQVLAINDQSSGAGVILETTRIRGVLRGNASGQPAIVGILADNRIKPGEKVLTAGGDQIFPRGLPVGEVQKVVNDPERDGFIQVIVKPAAHLNQLDEVMVITSTEPRFSQQQLEDMAKSKDLKGTEAAALIDQQKAAQMLADQKKANEIMAERLPGLTDPNAPAKPAAEAGQPGANPAQPAPTVVPKIIPPQHPDRFTPGAAPSSTTPITPDQPGTTAKPPVKKPTKPTTSTPQNPQPQEKP